MNIGEISLKWLGHAGFLIENYSPKGVHSSKGKIIYIDPYNIKEGLPKADLILITHGHYDHCSVSDLGKIVKEGTRIICPPDSQSKIARFEVPIRMQTIEVGQNLDFGNIKISVVPAYNIDKPFHTKEEGLVGYIIKMDDLILYHAGDTDLIPEMQKLTGFNQQNKNFVALLPVGGRFTMSAEEAAEAAKIIKPTISIPMHWGSLVGTSEDAKDFKNLCEEEGLNVEILEKE